MPFQQTIKQKHCLGPCKKIGVIKTAILSNLCQSFGVFFRSENGVHAKFYQKKSLRRSICSFIVLITLTKINIIYENCIHRNFSCDYLMPTRESAHCVGWLSVNIFWVFIKHTYLARAELRSRTKSVRREAFPLHFG